MSHELTWEDDGYYLRMWGTVTTHDMDSALAEIYSNNKSDYINYCIRDYLDVTKVDIDMSGEDVSHYVAFYEQTATRGSNNPLKVIAFLSGNEAMDSIIDKYIQIMSEHDPHTKFMKFSNVDDAREWVSRTL